MPDPSVLGWIAVIVLAGVGLAGMVLPVLPGAPVLFAGLALGAWLEDFEFVSHAKH